MNYEQAQSKLKDYKSKAKAARKEGKSSHAASFRAAARRVERKLRSIPKPAPAAPEGEDAAKG